MRRCNSTARPLRGRSLPRGLSIPSGVKPAGFAAGDLPRVLEGADGASHEVDSSDWSFFQATTHAFEECYEDGNWILLEPIMSVEVTAPEEFQGKSSKDLSRFQSSYTLVGIAPI